ncbi:prepilin-type N-terminal cleavage/methylation domain-containing protein [Bacillus salipaludis]|uniref:Competence type IV pilus minor pilin ComGD n=1 Tax=Bacillus salipaludis TaxID=2547811 RepID=A0A4R5VP10_9BACI|nr:competence type IV pilus minor pilin ComGD [Bacillus salipaludis]MDQ6599636.1 competence type IV pilus minor pilin ComGD [Bacillus salipaludis]TDK60096.1 prepilin-type N-terminal cleavage/methylation domain-containing protein [Bacillus salipaludis]
MKNHQQGFTLIESLLVLAIFLILSSITVFSVKPQANRMEDETFISQLKADLFFAQQYAISHQHEVYVAFSENEYNYYIYERNDLPRLVERYYSNNIHVYPGTLSLYFRFLPDGNISKFGSFTIVTKDKQYRVTFLIGKGRFYVTEE